LNRSWYAIQKYKILTILGAFVRKGNSHSISGTPDLTFFSFHSATYSSIGFSLFLFSPLRSLLRTTEEPALIGDLRKSQRSKVEVRVWAWFSASGDCGGGEEEEEEGQCGRKEIDGIAGTSASGGSAMN
jgi:hypothetical protein